MTDHVRLTDLEQVLLLAVLRLGTGAIGTSIQEEVDEHARRHVTIGSIHVTLSRLEEQGLVHSEMTEPRSVRGGKARRAYTVTREGRAALEWNRQIIESMWKGLPAKGET